MTSLAVRARKAIAATAMTVVVTGVFAASGPIGALPPPPDQLTADCSTPSYVSDQLVCSDPELRVLDTAVAQAVTAAEGAALVPETPLFESQGAWLRRRSLCAMRAAHKACLVAAYEDRLAGLKLLTSPASSAIRIWQCEIRQYGIVTLSGSTGPARIETSAGKAIGYASYNTEADVAGWTPYLRLVARGRKATLYNASGAANPCRAVSAGRAQ